MNYNAVASIRHGIYRVHFFITSYLNFTDRSTELQLVEMFAVTAVTVNIKFAETS